METIVQRACGLAVHQASITGCIMRQGIKQQIECFGTTTSELERLRDWLHSHQITHVAMESTGGYWKPVFNIIGEDFELLLVNARHVKHVPGRKTDVADSQWLCKLLRAGLLKGSFIPKAEIRELRNLTRYQKKLQHQLQSEKNRVHKILQEANIKLTSVLSDIFGVAGFHILEDLARGVTNPIRLSQHFARDKRLKAKQTAAQEALNGRFTPHHQFMLTTLLGHIRFLQAQIADIEAQVAQRIEAHQQEHELLQTIPGIKVRAANAIIAEIGTDMDQFPDEKHLASWAGLCPGNHESAGKKKAQS